MHVYIIEERSNGQPTGFLKVGKADSPTERLTGLRSGNPRELVVRSVFKCGKLAERIEKIAKERLGEHCVNGEWFAVPLEVAHACVEAIFQEQTATKEGLRLSEGDGNTRRDAVSSLQSLPAVFDIRDMEVLLGMDRGYIKNRIHRWSERNMIVPLGPKAGVYFNLVVDPNGPQTRIKESLDKLLGRAFVGIGAMSLHQYGWLPNQPQQKEIAVPVSASVRTIPKMNGIIAAGRLRGWFHAVLPKASESVDGIRIAPPEFALVEAIKSEGSEGLWNPSPSDIVIPDDIHPAEAVRRIEEAAVALKADIGLVREFMSRIDGLDDVLPSP